MIDALLFALRDAIRSAGYGYDGPNYCDVRGPQGKPPTNCGNLFVAIHELDTRSDSVRNLDERYSFGVTLTMRTQAPMSRVGDRELASKLARTTGPGSPSFNSRLDLLRSFCHMNWQVGIGDGTVPGTANYNLVQWTTVFAGQDIYGFVEPAHYVRGEQPQLVGPDWFDAAPEQVMMALKSTLTFDGARRMQPQVSIVTVGNSQAVGPFV